MTLLATKDAYRCNLRYQNKWARVGCSRISRAILSCRPRKQIWNAKFKMVSQDDRLIKANFSKVVLTHGSHLWIATHSWVAWFYRMQKPIMLCSESYRLIIRNDSKMRGNLWISEVKNFFTFLDFTSNFKICKVLWYTSVIDPQQFVGFWGENFFFSLIFTSNSANKGRKISLICFFQ